MEEKTEHQINSVWFTQLTHCGVSLKSFKYYGNAPELGAEELILLDKYSNIMEGMITDHSDKRVSEMLADLEAFSLRTFAGYIQSVKHHSSYGHKLYQKEWTLCYIFLGQLKLIAMKYPDVSELIMQLSFNDSSLLKEHKFLAFPKPAKIEKASSVKQTQKIYQEETSKPLDRAREKLRNAALSQERYKNYLRAHKLCNEVIDMFYESDQQEEFRQRGLNIIAPIEDLKLIKVVSALIQDKIQCTLLLQEEEGSRKEIISYIPHQGSSASSRKIDTTKLKINNSKSRMQALFQRIIKEFTEIKDKTKIMKNGLVIEARPDDYNLLLLIQDEISQIIKCKVYVRVKDYSAVEKHAGDTLVSFKF